MGPNDLTTPTQALNVDAADLLDAGGPADLRRLRTSAGLSARNLAARAHVSVPTYVRWESGRTKRLPARQVLKPLAKALDVTVEDVESALLTARAKPIRPTDPKKRTTESHVRSDPYIVGPDCRSAIGLFTKLLGAEASSDDHPGPRSRSGGVSPPRLTAGKARLNGAARRLKLTRGMVVGVWIGLFAALCT